MDGHNKYGLTSLSTRQAVAEHIAIPGWAGRCMWVPPHETSGSPAHYTSTTPRKS